MIHVEVISETGFSCIISSRGHWEEQKKKKKKQTGRLIFLIRFLLLTRIL